MLILVLVLMVIGSLIVIPLLDYGMSVTRANTVLSDKNKAQEASKAGLRVALADPQELYRHCAGESGSDNVAIGMPVVNGHALETDCDFLAFSHAAADDELHLGLAATKMGAIVPQSLTAVIDKVGGLEVIDPETGLPKRLVFEMDPDHPLDQWYVLPDGVDPDETRTLLSTPRRIWGPNLPVRHKDTRSALPYNMPGACGNDSCPPADCKVYFPGTYSDPLELSGNVYFTSGVYYFEDTVTVTGTADVVVGMGTHLGCTTDQQAAFYALDVPSPHNISGLGGTFVLGHDARLIVSNETGAPSLRFNQRYVSLTDLASPASFGVSIVSVNGAVDGEISEVGDYTLTDLSVPGVVQVPASQVGGVALPVQYAEMVGDEDDPELVIGPAEPANVAGYKPSTFTHAPRPPSAPLDVAVTEFRQSAGPTGGAAYVRWDPPERPGGLPTTFAVEVTNSTGGFLGSCGPVTEIYECVVTGLPTTGSNRPYRYTVTAENDLSTPEDIDAARSEPATGGPGVPADEAAPAAPTAPTIEVDAVYNGAVRVTWEALDESQVGTTRVGEYTVTAFVQPLPEDPPPDPPMDPEPPEATEFTCTVEVPLMLPDEVDPEHPDVEPVAPELPDPLYCTVSGLDPDREYAFTVTASNVNGTESVPSELSNMVAPLATLPSCEMDTPITADPPGCAPWTPPERMTYPYEPDPIVDIMLSAGDRADDKVVIDIPGYVAVPQGVFRLFNPNGLGTTDDGNAVQVSGGIVAAAFRVHDGRSETGDLTVPIGLINPIVQRTYKLTTCVPNCAKPLAKAVAVVQVNQNGAYAVNSWEVQ